MFGFAWKLLEKHGKPPKSTGEASFSIQMGMTRGLTNPYLFGAWCVQKNLANSHLPCLAIRKSNRSAKPSNYFGQKIAMPFLSQKIWEPSSSFRRRTAPCWEWTPWIPSHSDHRCTQCWAWTWPSGWYSPPKRAAHLESPAPGTEAMASCRSPEVSNPHFRG